MYALDAWAPLLYIKTKAWFKDKRFALLNHAGVSITWLKFSAETGINVKRVKKHIFFTFASN